MPAPKGNKNAVGNKGGRPPIHTDPETVDRLVMEYFIYIKGEYEILTRTYTVKLDGEEVEKTEEYKNWIRYPEPPTVTGLTLYLGFSHKSNLYKYADKVEFRDSIKKGLTKIEQFHEIKTSQGDKCVGNIFILKNFGWKDKSEVDIKQQVINWKEQKTYDSDKETN